MIPKKGIKIYTVQISFSLVYEERSTEMTDQLKITVPGKQEYIPVVRLAVASAANAAGFDIESIEDIKIAVTEVCEHIFCSNSRSTYEVSCEVSDSGMSISVHDVGNAAEDMSRMKKCFCLPVSDFMPELYDPVACMIMLGALMDDVSIFSCNSGDLLIRMLKLY